jgi:hypothetical protein
LPLELERYHKEWIPPLDIEPIAMTTVQISLPDQLAREAQRAGLLSPELLEKWLREQLKAQRNRRAVFSHGSRGSRK